MCLSHLIYTVRPCLIHTCHALTMPFFSGPQHSTAVETGPRSASSGYHAEFHEDCYQKHITPHNDPYLRP